MQETQNKKRLKTISIDDKNLSKVKKISQELGCAESALIRLAIRHLPEDFTDNPELMRELVEVSR